ncbi:EF-hand_domain pair [Hexamita inflata]|uniref:EF-hand domain pair n=1 Tax=Hexamita inflata TaxID=28002 RepID=A0AA86PES2_9EUKA|nr:EF-hand domain pair [Hexamita inflata]
MPKYTVAELKKMFKDSDMGATDGTLRFSEVATYFKNNGIPFEREHAKALFAKYDVTNFKNAGGSDNKLEVGEYIKFMNELFP